MQWPGLAGGVFSPLRAPDIHWRPFAQGPSKVSVCASWWFGCEPLAFVEGEWTSQTSKPPINRNHQRKECRHFCLMIAGWLDYAYDSAGGL